MSGCRNVYHLSDDKRFCTLTDSHIHPINITMQTNPLIIVVVVVLNKSNVIGVKSILVLIEIWRIIPGIRLLKRTARNPRRIPKTNA